MCHPDRRDMIPGRTYSFVMWAGDAKGRESAKSNRLTVTLPVDTAPPAAPDVSVTDTTSSTVGLAWGPVSDDDSTCCKYRVFANGVLVSADNLQWTGERAVTVLRLAAATALVHGTQTSNNSACRRSTASATARRRAPSR
jgi:hypothetical protein